MDQRTKRTLWIIAGVVVFVALVPLAIDITRAGVIVFCVIVPSIILHEVSHGWVANAFGDDTAKRAGRLTLNPVAHVDPVGTLIVPALLSLGRRRGLRLGQAGAGEHRATAQPAQPGRAGLPGRPGHQRRAGRHFRRRVHQGDPARTAGIRQTSRPAPQIVFYIGLVNVWLCIFNLIPIPPLDGSVLFERLLPARYWPTYLRYRQYTMPILWAWSCSTSSCTPTGRITWLFNQLSSWWTERARDSSAQRSASAAARWRRRPGRRSPPPPRAAWAAPLASTSWT